MTKSSAAVLEILARKFAAASGPDPVANPLIRWAPGWTPLVFDSPHSGVDYPDDFGHSCPIQLLRQAEDTHVEKLFDFAAKSGVGWVEALFPRSYLDLNRAVTEIDDGMLAERWPERLGQDEPSRVKVRLGKGLIWRCLDDGTPIYSRQLSVREVQSRIDRYWRPYNTKLRELVEAAYGRHGYCIHVNCHSMPSTAGSHATEFPGLKHADFVVGDRDGSTSNPALSKRICSLLESSGFTVGYNFPYKGVEIVRQFGAPEENRHSIQLEINRRLYMNEETLEPHAGFSKVQTVLRSITADLLENGALCINS